MFPRFKLQPPGKERERQVYLWGKALSDGGYPPHVYPEALIVHARNTTGGDPPGVGDILLACRRAIELIEQDPVRRKKLYEWREKKMKERERALAQDTP